MIRRFLVGAFGLMFAGCATVNMPELPATHPAHPEALVSPEPAVPTVLTMHDNAVARPPLPIYSEPTPSTGEAKNLDAEMGQIHAHESPGPGGVEQHMMGQIEKTGPFRCPIHPESISDKPGQCTVCGLPLRQASPAAGHMFHGTLSAAGESQGAPIMTGLYACPMHPEVTSVEAGACPKCGMDLKKKGD